MQVMKIQKMHHTIAFNCFESGIQTSGRLC